MELATEGPEACSNTSLAALERGGFRAFIATTQGGGELNARRAERPNPEKAESPLEYFFGVISIGLQMP